MSSIAVTGSATGTGVISLLAPVTNTNRTINLPDSNGTIVTSATAGVPIGGPAFSAYQSTLQSTSSGVTTKILFQTEEFDTNSNFASSTFTPTVAGYYQVTGGVVYAGSTAAVVPFIYKNGAVYKRGTNPPTSGGAAMSALVYCNGTTDYVEFYSVSFATQNTSVGIELTYFQAAMVRSAV